MTKQEKNLNMVTRKFHEECNEFRCTLQGVSINSLVDGFESFIVSLKVNDNEFNVLVTFDEIENKWLYTNVNKKTISNNDNANKTIIGFCRYIVIDIINFNKTIEENAECAKGNDVFDGCKQKLPKTETNKIKGHIYIDTDSVKVAPLPEQQTNEKSMIDTIIADDNIAYQTAKVTKTKQSVLDVMQCMMCPADREGNRCGGEQWCMQTWRRYGAMVNPEYHHVSIATLANIDVDMLDEKRKLLCNINQILKDGIRNLYKCENHISFEVLERYVIRQCDELIRHNRLKAFWFSYIARQLDEVRRNTNYLYTPYITAHRNRW